MFAWLADFVARRWWLVLLAWVATAVVVQSAPRRWDEVAQDGDFAFLPPGMTSVRGEDLTRPGVSRRGRQERRGADRGPVATVPWARPITPWPTGLAQEFAPRQERQGQEGLISAVHTADDPIVGDKLTSRPGRDGQATLVLLELRTEFMAVENMDLLAAPGKAAGRGSAAARIFPRASSLGITGSAAVGADMLFSAEESIRNTEWTTVALVVLILLVVYRAPGLVIVPLVVIFASLELSDRRDCPAGAAGSAGRLVRLQGLPYHEDFHRCGARRRRDRLLPVSRLTLSRGIATRVAAMAGPARGAGQRGRRRGGQRHDHHPRPGNDDLRRLRQVPLRRADHRAVAGRGPAGLPDAGPGHAFRRSDGSSSGPSASAPHATPTSAAPPGCGASVASHRPGGGDQAGIDLRRLPAGVGMAGLRGASRCRSPTTWWRS